MLPKIVLAAQEDHRWWEFRAHAGEVGFVCTVLEPLNEVAHAFQVRLLALAESLLDRCCALVRRGDRFQVPLLVSQMVEETVPR